MSRKERNKQKTDKKTNRQRKTAKTKKSVIGNGKRYYCASLSCPHEALKEMAT